MANANVPQFNLDPNDPTVQGMTDAQRTFVNDFLQRQVMMAGRAIRVANLNTAIEIPKYKPNTMTADSFFAKCTNYLDAQGYAAQDHHLYLPVIMKGDFKLWYD